MMDATEILPITAINLWCIVFYFFSWAENGITQGKGDEGRPGEAARRGTQKQR